MDSLSLNSQHEFVCNVVSEVSARLCLERGPTRRMRIGGEDVAVCRHLTGCTCRVVRCNIL